MSIPLGAFINDGVPGDYDELDPTTVNMPARDYRRALRMQTSRLRLGVPRRTFFDGLDAEIAKAVDSAIVLQRSADHKT